MRIAFMSVALAMSAFAQHSTPPAPAAAKPVTCTNPAEKPAVNPEFNGVLICHDDALELENAGLKLAHLHELGDPIAQHQHMIMMKVLSMNPGYGLDPQSGQFRPLNARGGAQGSTPAHMPPAQATEPQKIPAPVIPERVPGLKPPPTAK